MLISSSLIVLIQSLKMSLSSSKEIFLCRNTLNMKLQTGSSHVVNPVVVLMCSVPSASPCVLGEDPHMD